LDPLFHPLGALLMIYLSHFSSGFLIHASGIMENNNGYIFSGVSGIGKSTMSEIWLKQGATVINDDRLWIQKIGNEWKIYKSDDELFIHIDFFKNDTICEVLARINFSEKTVFVDIIPHTSSQITMDPLFLFFGALLMIYLSHFSSGFLIHASGIKDNNAGYIFSGVSGIGKSTMSEIWLKQGATVINDDRLWIQKIDNEWKIFSTPMNYYEQEPIIANLSKIFLLSQSADNYITQIPNTQGALRVMANCIQHLFDKEMTASYLDTIFDMSSRIPIYELGFRPTAEIVNVIRKMR
jgi:adenylate kinase